MKKRLELNRLPKQVNWKELIAKRQPMVAYCQFKKLPRSKKDDTPPPAAGTTAAAGKIWISGIANANIVDRVLERLDPAGCDLENYTKNPILLANHSYNIYEAVGCVPTLEVKDDGLHFEGWVGDPQLGELTECQNTARSLISQGILQTVSVGFIPKGIEEAQYDDKGNMIQGAIITKWELLEISLIPVPCNADSIFTSEETPGGDQAAKAAPDPTTIQTLVFDKSKYGEGAAVKWAHDHKFHADKVDVTEDSYRIRQRDPGDFEEGSFRTIELTDGVKAVIGKVKKSMRLFQPAVSNDNLKENTEGTDPMANEKTVGPEEMVKEIHGHVKGMAEDVKAMHEVAKSSHEMIKSMYKKADKPVADDAPKDKPKDSADDADADDAKKRLGVLEADLKSLTGSLTQLTEAVKKIAGI